eukprot:g5718.t1
MSLGSLGLCGLLHVSTALDPFIVADVNTDGQLSRPEFEAFVAKHHASDRKAFSFTYVTYDDADPLGFVLAGITLTPIFIMVMYATLVLFRRDVHTLAMLAGQLLNEASSVVLKRVVGAPTSRWRHLAIRPPLSDKTDAGWPSSHTQFMFFFATYSALFIFRRVTLEVPAAKPVLCLGLEMLALAVAFSRVHLHYHTPEQVVAGGVIGVVFGGLWFSFVAGTLAPHFGRAAAWKLLRYFNFKDTTHVPFLHRFERLCALKAAAAKAQHSD